MFYYNALYLGKINILKFILIYLAFTNYVYFLHAQFKDDNVNITSSSSNLNSSAYVSPFAPYRKIIYVKNNVPFLLQFDNFLKNKEILITFDDGPVNNGCTEKICDILKEYSIPAIFFVLGKCINSATADLLKKEAITNNEISVHGFYHATEKGLPFTAYDWPTIKEHLSKVKNLIYKITAQEANFFRPPYGIIRESDLIKVEKELNLIPLGWTIDSLDWTTKDSEILYQKMVTLISKRGKGILLMHDIHPQSEKAFRKLAKWLKDNRYTVVLPSYVAKIYKRK